MPLIVLEGVSKRYQPGDPPAVDGLSLSVEPGEILRIEIPYYEVGWAGLNLRDTVLVTARGSHVMNRSVRGLVVLD